MILSQFEEAVWHRRGSDCDIAEAWHHGGEIVPAVEAVLEFGEVAGYMLVTLVKRLGLDQAVMLPGANRADKAGWPAPAPHRLPALILCSVKNRKLGLAEPLLKLHLVARHRSNPQKQQRRRLFVRPAPVRIL